MSETRFTPGPWKRETVKTSIGVCHKIGPLGKSTKLNHACLYDDCYSETPRDLQLLADAALIAAAPDLYTALLELLGEIDENECSAGTSVRIGNARRALARARGEQ